MNITTKGRYALKIMIDLAAQAGDAPVSLKAVSERQGISMKYLEAIAGVLNKSGFLLSSRGKNGGYRLAKQPKDYTVCEILRSTEGSLAPVACVESDCPNAEGCVTLPLWAGLDHCIDTYLSGITLQDVLDGTIPK